MDMQILSVKDRVKYEVIFWGITAFFSLYLVPAIIVCIINPFWFRQDMYSALQDQIRNISDWRARQVKPIEDKYRMFDILKD